MGLRTYQRPCTCTSGTRSFVSSWLFYSTLLSDFISCSSLYNDNAFDNFNNFGHPAQNAIFLNVLCHPFEKNCAAVSILGSASEKILQPRSELILLRVGVTKTVVFLLSLRLTISKTQFSYFYIEHPSSHIGIGTVHSFCMMYNIKKNSCILSHFRCDFLRKQDVPYKNFPLSHLEGKKFFFVPKYDDSC